MVIIQHTIPVGPNLLGGQNGVACYFEKDIAGSFNEAKGQQAVC